MQRRLRLVSVHGESTGPPVETIDDFPLKRAIVSVTQGSTKTSWRYVLQRQEAEALFRVLRGRIYTPARLQAAVEFLWMIDPQDKNTGWSDERLRNYIHQSAKTLHKRWASNLLVGLQDSITRVKQRTGEAYFRGELLSAALFFFCTGHQEQISQRATG